jgi:hypothetical protein
MYAAAGGVFELIDGGDVVLLGGFFVDQIALGGA